MVNKRPRAFQVAMGKHSYNWDIAIYTPEEVEPVDVAEDSIEYPKGAVAAMEATCMQCPL